MGTHELSNILTNGRLLLDRLKAEVYHLFRDANFSADAVAKVNLNSSDNSLVVFQPIPNY